MQTPLCGFHRFSWWISIISLVDFRTFGVIVHNSIYPPPCTATQLVFEREVFFFLVSTEREVCLARRLITEPEEDFPSMVLVGTEFQEWRLITEVSLPIGYALVKLLTAYLLINLFII
jgi:hypothetical protein